MFGAIVVLFRSVLPLDPRSAGALLTDAGDRRDLDFALALIPFCGIFFLWFLGAVRAHIGEAEDKFFATIVLGSGLLFIAMLFVFGALFGALISLAGLYDGHPPLALWRLGREISFNIAIVYAMRVGAVFMLSSSVIAFRLRIHAQEPSHRGRLRRCDRPVVREPNDPLAAARLSLLGAAGQYRHPHPLVPEPEPETHAVTSELLPARRHCRISAGSSLPSRRTTAFRTVTRSPWCSPGDHLPESVRHGAASAPPPFSDDLRRADRQRSDGEEPAEGTRRRCARTPPPASCSGW